ncbi:MAG: alpha/beta hydrolase [Candidatus Tumulicola sp.]
MQHAPPTPVPAIVVRRFSNLAYAGDGLDAHRLDLYVPQGVENAPIVVFVHGGAFMDGDRRGYSSVGQAMARQGLATAVVSYRLWPQVDAGGATADVATATAWTIAHAAQYQLTPRNVFLTGHSAGAQIVAILGTNPAYLRAAGSSLGAIRGVFAVAGAYDVRDLSGEPDSWQAIDGHIYGRTPQARSAYSPQLHIDAGTPPIETACGTQDDPWACNRAIDFAAALRAAGRQAWAFKEVGADHMGMLRAWVLPGDPLNTEFLDFITQLEVP